MIARIRLFDETVRAVPVFHKKWRQTRFIYKSMIMGTLRYFGKRAEGIVLRNLVDAQKRAR